MSKFITIIFIFCLEVFFSLDNLQAQSNWTQINGPSGGTVHSMEFVQGYYFAGTTNGGLFLSTNNGNKWSFISKDVPFLDIEGVLFYNNRIFVWNRQNGIYISDDLGISWNYSQNGITTQAITKVVQTDGKLFCSTIGDGVFYSSDNGNSWAKRNFSLKSLNVNNLFVHLGSVYAACSPGVFVSGNDGQSWNEIRETGNYNHIAIYADNIFIASSNQILFTTNNGQVWTSVSSIGSGTIYSLLATGSYIIAGRNSGIFVTTYPGDNLNVHSTLSGQRVNAVRLVNNFLWAATTNGIFFSQDYGGKWKDSYQGILNERVMSILIDKNTIYTGLRFNGLLKSTDGGETWEDMNLGKSRISSLLKKNNGLYAVVNDTNILYTETDGIVWDTKDFGIDNVVINFIKSNQNSMYAGTSKGIYYTTNNGNKWNHMNEVLKLYDFRDIIFGQNNYIYMATNDKVLITWNNGTTHEESGQGMKSFNITALTGSDSLLVAGSLPDADFDGDIYFSKDKGKTWTTAGLNFRDFYVNDIEIAGSIIFASVVSISGGESTGILLSTNMGKSWKEFNDGIRVKDIYDILIHGNDVYVCTNGSGFYKNTIPEPLGIPEITYPPNNAVDIPLNVVFDWTNLNEAEFYNLQVSSRFDPFDKNLIIDTSTTISQLVIDDTLLKNRTDYFWRIRISKNGVTGDWSEIFSFKTEADIPTVSTLLLPVDNAVNVKVMTKLEWELLSEASEYNIVISEIESGTVTNSVVDENVTMNSYTIPKGAIKFEQEYLWKVRALIHGVYRDWSNEFTFKTASLNLTIPELIAPIDNSTDLSLDIALEWNSVEDADEFVIRLSKDDAFTDIVLMDTIGNTILNLTDETLDFNTQYYWAVKSKYLNFESDWSITRTFKTMFEISVEEFFVLEQSKLLLKPTYVNEEISIEYTLPFNTKINLNIVDIFGKQIYQIENNLYYLKNQTILKNIEIGSMPAGIYFVNLETKHGNKVQKFFVIK